MKLDRVFLAFLKTDGEEHLLYKKSEGNYYYDLITKDKHHINDIDYNTLIYFKDSINCYGLDHCKRFIKKLYKEDRSKLVVIDELCIVDVNKATKVERKFFDGYRVRNWNPIYLYKNLVEECLSGYKDIRNGNMYNNQNYCYLEDNDIYVNTGKDSNIKYLREIYPGMKSMEKRKLLKLQYDVMNSKTIN